MNQDGYDHLREDADRSTLTDREARCDNPFHWALTDEEHASHVAACGANADVDRLRQHWAMVDAERDRQAARRMAGCLVWAALLVFAALLTFAVINCG